ncbi:MAG: sulfatase/phosphatase domain-containing protein, partial [Planctomycetota bacterium]
RTVAQYIQRAQFELFDLENDPDEVENLADRPEHQELLAEMKSELKTFQQKTKDPWILKWKYE